VAATAQKATSALRVPALQLLDGRTLEIRAEGSGDTSFYSWVYWLVILWCTVLALYVHWLPKSWNYLHALTRRCRH